MNRLEAVIFDWAGTTIDFGSMAPVAAITRLFAQRGIQLSDPEVRQDVGLFKKDHIRRILKSSRVREEWQRAKAQTPTENDVDSMFKDFAAIQMEALEHHSEVIRGVAGLAENLRRRGLKIGGTTGYTRPMLDLLVARASDEGYRPDLSYCPDDVGGGRPHPWMCLRLATEFRLSATAAAVKVGDTLSDIEEGLNAGMWTVGVAVTGNEMGLTPSQLASLARDEYGRRLTAIRDRMKAAGAHYVIDSAEEMDLVVEQIDCRLAAGERP